MWIALGNKLNTALKLPHTITSTQNKTHSDWERNATGGSILCMIWEEHHLERCRWSDARRTDDISCFSAPETLRGTQHWNNRRQKIDQ